MIFKYLAYVVRHFMYKVPGVSLLSYKEFKEIVG